jgi:carbon storage regulator
MLVLSRKAGEKIIVNDGEIVFTLVSIQGGQAKIGIDAPSSVPIHREEIYKKVVSDGRKNKISGVNNDK